MADDDSYATQNSTAATAGQFFQIYVPNWGQDGGGTNLSSFIRLGATPSGFLPPTATASTLVGLFSGFFDDPRQRYDPGAGNTAPTQSLPGVTGSAPDGGLTFAQRATETGNLETKGGWWDHSDGNRISTTQGDKVEVIRGNYQLIVLGRQDSTGNGATLDMSGGLTQPNDATPANVMRLEWVRNYDGTWRIVEECQKGDVHNVVHGDVVEEQYGNTITSITGSELQTVLTNPEFYVSDPSLANGTVSPALVTENNDLFDPQSPAYLGATTVLTKKNPTITEKTWAESITSNTGSAACPVPTITEQTFAGAIVELTTAGSITSTTTAGTTQEITTVGAALEISTIGAKVGVTLGGAELEAKVVPIMASIEIGAKLDIWLGAKLEISAPERWQFGVEDGKIVAESTKAAAEEQRLVDIESSISNVHTAIAFDRSEIDEMRTALHGQNIYTAEEEIGMALQQMFGV